MFTLHRYSLLLVCVATIGCSTESGEQVAPGSRTQSVEAAKAFNRGQALHEADKAAAVKEYSKAIEHDPNFAAAIYSRALANAGLAHDEDVLADLARLKAMNAKEAETLEQLLKFTPVVYSNQGQQALSEGKYEFAIDRFTASLLYAKDDPGLLDLRADAHEKLGNQDQAQADRAAATDARNRGVESIFAQDE